MSDIKHEQTFIISDLLSFVCSKVNDFPRKRLLKCMQDFYPKAEASEACEMLIESLPQYSNLRHWKRLKKQDPYLAILKCLEQFPESELPQFVCRNLDNVPKISFMKKEILKKRTRFIEEHKALKIQINDLYRSLYQLKQQFVLLHKKTLVLSGNFSGQSKGSDLAPRKYQRPLTFNSGIKKDITYLQQFIDEDSDTEEGTVLNLSLGEESCSDLLIKTEAEGYHDNEELQLSCISLNGNNESADPLAIKPKEENLFENGTEKNFDFLIIEQMFDENIGHFTLFKCSFCSFTSNDEATATNHECQQVSEMTDKTKRRKFTCFTCMICFQSQSDLKVHKKNEHQNTKRKYRCPLCTDSYPEAVWQEHVRLCLGNGENVLTQEDIYCSDCDVFFSDEKLLKNHRALHDKSRPFECHDCKFRFYSKKMIKEHFKAHLLEKAKRTCKCPFCNRRFIHASKLEEHIRTHTGERPFKCSVCDFTAARPGGLTAHLKIHTEQKDYVCDICSKGFKLKSKMMVHRKTHSSNRPFKCPDCGKGFKSGREMTLHHRNHLGIRNHPCPYCSYKAVNAAVLRGHINVHFNKKPFKCTQCNFGSNHKSYLNFHMRNAHPNVVLA